MLINTAWSVTPAKPELTAANNDGGTGMDATFPAILVDDSTRLVSFNGTKLPWISNVNVNSDLASLIAHDPWSCDLSSSLQTKYILLFSANSIALLSILLFAYFKSKINGGVTLAVFSSEWQEQPFDKDILKGVEGYQDCEIIWVKSEEAKKVTKKLRLRNFPSIALFFEALIFG